MGSGTDSEQGLRVLVSYLEGKGVEVAQLKKALEQGDSATVESWFETSYRRHVAKILEGVRQGAYPRTSVRPVEVTDGGTWYWFFGEATGDPSPGRKNHLPEPRGWT